MLYGVIFSKNPVDDVERVLDNLLQPGNAWSKEYLSRSVDAALRSDEPLAELLPMDHAERTVREYLAAAQASLKKR